MAARILCQGSIGAADSPSTNRSIKIKTLASLFPFVSLLDDEGFQAVKATKFHFSGLLEVGDWSAVNNRNLDQA